MKILKLLFLTIIISLFLVKTSFSLQISPVVSGKPIKIKETDNYYVVGLQNMLYVFEKNGTLKNYIDVKELSDFLIDNKKIIITETSQRFPNVKAYSFPELKLLWEFEPKMLVFDINLVWQEKEPKSWRIKKISDGYGLCSGYRFYIMSKDGKVLNEFKAENDVWDFVEKNGKYYLACQDGNVYVLNKNLELEEKIKACLDYKLINPISNTTKIIIPRSAWEITEDLIVACEDGNVYFINEKRREVIETYPSQLLYSYYSENERETSFFDQMYKNLKIKKFGNKTIAFTTSKIVVIENNEIKWEKAVDLFDLDSYGNEIYAINSKYGNEIISIYDISNGEKLDELFLNKLQCKKSGYKIFSNENNILIASPCEIKLIKKNGDVKWYFPLAESLNYEELNGTYIFFNDNRENILDDLQAYFLVAVKDGKFLWEYILPYKMRENGEIVDIKTLNSGKVILFYSEDKGNNKIIVLNAEDGKVENILNATDRIFAGVLDNYLLNETLMETIREFNFSIIDQIPEEIKEGRIQEAIQMYGNSNVRNWLNIIENLPLDLEILENFRHIDFQNINDMMMRRNIRKMDVCDYNNDGYDDLLISAEGYIVLRDGKDMKELWLKDRDTWKYENGFNRPYKENFTASWYDSDYIVFCVDDINNDDKKDLLLVAPSGEYKLLLSQNNNYTVKWKRYVRNLKWDRVKKIKDIDGDGISEFIIPVWQLNRPDIVKFVSIENHKELNSLILHKFSIEFNQDDINNDGKNESIIFYEHEGGKLKIFSSNYDWAYSKIENFWDVWNKYNYMLPCVIVDDMNNDGIKEIACGIVNKNREGAKLFFMDTKNEKKMKDIDIEKSRFEFDEREWAFVTSMKRKGDLLIFTMPVMNWENENGKVCIYNISSDSIDSFIHLDTKRIIKDKEIILIGVNGEIYNVKESKDNNVSINVNGNLVNIKIDGDSYTNVYVDGTFSASTRKNNISMRLSNGNHEIAIHVINRDGYEKIIYKNISTFAPSSLSFLNIIFVVMIVIYISIKAVIKWKRR